MLTSSLGLVPVGYHESWGMLPIAQMLLSLSKVWASYTASLGDQPRSVSTKALALFSQEFIADTIGSDSSAGWMPSRIGGVVARASEGQASITTGTSATAAARERHKWLAMDVPSVLGGAADCCRLFVSSLGRSRPLEAGDAVPAPGEVRRAAARRRHDTADRQERVLLLLPARRATGSLVGVLTDAVRDGGDRRRVRAVVPAAAVRPADVPDVTGRTDVEQRDPGAGVGERARRRDAPERVLVGAVARGDQRRVHSDGANGACLGERRDVRDLVVTPADVKQHLVRRCVRQATAHV